MIACGMCGTMSKTTRRRERKLYKYYEREKRREQKRFRHKTAKYGFVTSIVTHFYEMIYKGKKYYFDRGQMTVYK